MLMLTKITKTATSHLVEITDGKKTMQVWASEYNIMICQTSNASHKVWGGLGKSFQTFEQAIESYKSAFMKDSIAMAQQAIAAA